MEFQCALVIADIGKRKVVRKTCAERRDNFAERCVDQDAILRKSNQII